MALLDVILGYDCNLWCDYCTITAEMRRRALPTAKVLAELRRGRALGYDAVSFTGGEPTIRKDLLGLVRKARELGYEDRKVQSNGLVYAQPPNVERAVEAGVNRFHVSIHTHDREHYDRLVRAAGSWPLMAAGLDNLVARGVRLTVDVIMKSDTYEKVPDAIDWLAARGVCNVHLWFVSLTDGNRDNLASLPKMTDVVPFMHEAFERGRAHGMAVRSLHVPRCLLGRDVDRAWDPGAQRVMVVTPEATFELKDSKITPNTHVPACEGCQYREVCPGVRPDYLEVYGDGEIAAARGQRPATAPSRLPVVGGAR